VNHVVSPAQAVTPLAEHLRKNLIFSWRIVGNSGLSEKEWQWSSSPLGEGEGYVSRFEGPRGVEEATPDPTETHDRGKTEGVNTQV
jgi:hypothetical protein